jgi:hypothetical protein
MCCTGWTVSCWTNEEILSRSLDWMGPKHHNVPRIVRTFFQIYLFSVSTICFDWRSILSVFRYVVAVGYVRLLDILKNFFGFSQWSSSLVWVCSSILMWMTPSLNKKLPKFNSDVILSVKLQDYERSIPFSLHSFGWLLISFQKHWNSLMLEEWTQIHFLIIFSLRHLSLSFLSPSSLLFFSTLTTSVFCWCCWWYILYFLYILQHKLNCGDTHCYHSAL